MACEWYFLALILILLVFKLITDNPEGQISDLDKAIPYGEYLKWDEVNRVFPKNATAAVIDFDTGMQFQVQRRGGYNHVDVQPLAADDTAIMKSIYEGKWAWKRKAVIIQLKNGQRIAASMNGMPHGQGAIKENISMVIFAFISRILKPMAVKKLIWLIK